MSKNLDRVVDATVFILAVGVVVGASFLVENEAKRTVWAPQQASQVSELADMVIPLQDTVIWDEREISALNMKLSKLEGKNKDLQADIRQDEVTIGGLHSTISDLEKKVCQAPSAPVVVEREADPANCAALKEFRNYDETKNSAKDFDYLKFKMQRFNGTNATQESRNRFRCHTLYQGQIWQHRDN
jgi:hypothetical protein